MRGLRKMFSIGLVMWERMGNDKIAKRLYVGEFAGSSLGGQREEVD